MIELILIAILFGFATSDDLELEIIADEATVTVEVPSNAVNTTTVTALAEVLTAITQTSTGTNTSTNTGTNY